MPELTSAKFFQRGDRVVLTKEAQEILVKRYKTVKKSQIYGTVTSNKANTSHCILVVLDGTETPRQFDADYWRRLSRTKVLPIKTRLKHFLLWARNKKVGPRKRMTDLSEGQVNDLVLTYLRVMTHG